MPQIYWISVRLLYALLCFIQKQGSICFATHLQQPIFLLLGVILFSCVMHVLYCNIYSKVLNIFPHVYSHPCWWQTITFSLLKYSIGLWNESWKEPLFQWESALRLPSKSWVSEGRPCTSKDKIIGDFRVHVQGNVMVLMCESSRAWTWDRRNCVCIPASWSGWLGKSLTILNTFVKRDNNIYLPRLLSV